MSARPGPFDPKVVLALVLFGAIAFIAALYFIGSGQTGRDLNSGNGHAGGKGLNGFSAFAQYLEAEGHDVTISRNAGDHDDYGLLILTPPHFADADDINAILKKRTYVGPTLIILPKWIAINARSTPGSNAKDGWVHLVGTQEAKWPEELEDRRRFEPRLSGMVPIKPGDNPRPRAGTTWSGLGTSGRLPRSETLDTFNPNLIPLITGADGGTLVGYGDDGGDYPRLDEEAGVERGSAENSDTARWPVMFVVEPDLVNNAGFVSRTNADTMHYIIDLLSDDGDLPVTFDVTLNGLGGQQNLLTLAFSPPFLAATLCLILALLVVGWRAFRRFGPPVAEAPGIAFGKERLVRNSAGFIQRSKRLHLLTGPYADMVERRIAKALGLRATDPVAIGDALRRRHPAAPDYTESAYALRGARTPKDILHAAAAMRSIERILNP